jgi:surfactin synthase thioesterase subunit
VAATSQWLHPADAEQEAEIRLFLFHHSGGNVTRYRQWEQLLPSDISSQCVQLPGRLDRRGERPYTRLQPLVEAVVQALAADLDDRPYALFGHSMGAILAYRVAVTMRARGAQPPALVAASGWAPEGFTAPPEWRPAADSTADELVEAMHRLGALPAPVGDDPEMLAAAVGALRADIAVCGDYLDDGAVVPCPVVAYAGRGDPLLAPGAMRSWAARTPEYLGCREFPEGHFFIDAHASAVTADLARLLRRYAGQHQRELGS